MKLHISLSYRISKSLKLRGSERITDAIAIITVFLTIEKLVLSAIKVYNSFANNNQIQYFYVIQAHVLFFKRNLLIYFRSFSSRFTTRFQLKQQNKTRLKSKCQDNLNAKLNQVKLSISMISKVYKNCAVILLVLLSITSKSYNFHGDENCQQLNLSFIIIYDEVFVLKQIKYYVEFIYKDENVTFKMFIWKS